MSRVFENRVLWEALGIREKGQQDACTGRSVIICSPDVSRVMKSRRIEYVAL